MELYQRRGNYNKGNYDARETLFPCPYEGCSYKSNNRNNWRVHRQMHKIRETKRFGCDECDYAATYAEKLRDHVNTVHRNIKAHRCDKCGYITGFRTILAQHMKKPHFVCEYCQTFVTTGKTKMERHVKNVHARLHNGSGSSAIQDERVPSERQEDGTRVMQRDETSKRPSDPLPVAKIDSGSRNTVPIPRDPNEEVFTYSSIEEARAHGLSLGSCFKTKTSKLDTNWRYHCKELNCPAKWSILERKYTDGSSSFLLRINQQHKHFLSDVKSEYDQDGDVRMNVQKFDEEKEEGGKYFSCDFKGCSFKAMTTKGLKDHKESHKAKGPRKTWACRWCDYTTTAQQLLLTLHVNSVHLNFKPYKCDICDFAGATKRSVTYHVEKKHERKGFKYQCDKCDFTTQFSGTLHRHKENRHRGISGKGPWNCDFCGFEAKDRQDVVDHILEKHREVRTDECDLCNFVTIGHAVMTNHKKSHKAVVIAECNQCDFESASRVDVVKHKRDAHGVPYEYVCEFCGKDYPNSASFNVHKAKCSAPDPVKAAEKKKWTPQPIQCDLCEFVSKKGKRVMMYHTQQHHDNIDISLACQKCEFQTETIKSIEEHAREHGGPPTACGACSFSAHHTPILLAHFETVHESKCKFCSYETSNIQGLKNHIRRKHGKLDATLCNSICDRCGFAALDAIDLRRHIDEKHGLSPNLF